MPLYHPPIKKRRLRPNRHSANGGLYLPVLHDGPSFVFVPTSAVDFGEIGVVPMNHVWPCQDISGSDLVDVVGGVSLLTQGPGTHLWQQTVTGWDRKYIGSQNDNEVVAWRRIAGEGPNPAVGSVAWYYIGRYPAVPAAIRVVFVLTNFATGHIRLQIQTDGKLNLVCNTTGSMGTYNYLDGDFHPYVIDYDRSAQQILVITDKEAITGSFNFVSDGTKGFGSTSGGSTGVYQYAWAACATGSNAERDWKNELKKFGWPIAY